MKKKCSLRVIWKVRKRMCVCTNLCSDYSFRSTRFVQRIQTSAAWWFCFPVARVANAQPAFIAVTVVLFWKYSWLISYLQSGVFFWGWKNCLNYCLRRKEGEWVCRCYWGKSAVVNQTVNVLRFRGELNGYSAVDTAGRRKILKNSVLVMTVDQIMSVAELFHRTAGSTSGRQGAYRCWALPRCINVPALPLYYSKSGCFNSSVQSTVAKNQARRWKCPNSLLLDLKRGFKKTIWVCFWICTLAYLVFERRICV